MQNNPLANPDVFQKVRMYVTVSERMCEAAKALGPTAAETRRLRRLANAWARELRDDHCLDVDDLTAEYAKLEGKA